MKAGLLPYALLESLNFFKAYLLLSHTYTHLQKNVDMVIFYRGGDLGDSIFLFVFSNFSQ